MEVSKDRLTADRRRPLNCKIWGVSAPTGDEKLGLQSLGPRIPRRYRRYAALASRSPQSCFFEVGCIRMRQNWRLVLVETSGTGDKTTHGVLCCYPRYMNQIG